MRSPWHLLEQLGVNIPASRSVDAEPCPVSLLALFQHRYPYLRHYTGFLYRISLYLYDYFTLQVSMCATAQPEKVRRGHWISWNWS